MRRMLIVDDEDTIRWALRELFAQDGWDVHAAADGEEALRKILECTYDFMITDLKMPGRHGVEVIGEARRLNPRMGVAVLTGYASVETAIDALRMRAWDYLTKPFDMRYLKQSIEGYFREMAARDGQGPDEVLDVKGERPAGQPLHQNSKFEFVGKFAGGVAHDFNNLLTGIAGYAELARAASQEGSTVRRDLNQILDLAQRAEELTRQLQAFSRRRPAPKTFQTAARPGGRLRSDRSETAAAPGNMPRSLHSPAAGAPADDESQAAGLSGDA